MRCLDHYSMYLILTLLAACGGPSPRAQPSAIVDADKPFLILDEADPLYQAIGSLENNTVRGTAFRIGPDLVLTNYHLTASCTYAVCDLLFQGRFPLELRARRLQADIALLAFVGATRPPAQEVLFLAASDPLKGSYKFVQSFENEAGQELLRQSESPLASVVQHSYGSELRYAANTIPGSSGSPLINADGAVMGIHKGYEADAGLNSGTLLTNQMHFLREDLVGEAQVLLAAYAQGKSPELKFDLGEILLQAIQHQDACTSRLLASYRISPLAESLLAYLSAVRKIDLHANYPGHCRSEPEL